MKNLFSLIIISTLFLIDLTPAQLAGHYQIGPGGDFLTFTEAIDSLVSQGVSDSVIFDVQTGTYHEQFVIPEISGTSNTNTITFQSQAGVADSVVLWDSTTQTNNYVVKLDGADYIAFKHLTLESHSVDYGRIFDLENNARYNSITNSILNVLTSGSSTNNLATIFSPEIYNQNSCDNLLVSNNTFNQGYGIFLQNHSNYPAGSTRILNNTFNNMRHGIYLRNHVAPLVSGNTVLVNWSSGSGIIIATCPGALKVTKNRVKIVRYEGIQIDGCLGSSGGRGLIANNFVRAGTPTYGSVHPLLVSGNSHYQDIYHNTIIFESAGFTGGYGLGVNSGGNNIRLQNNCVFTPDDSRPYIIETPAAITVSDYNNIYSAGNFLVYWGGTGCPDLDSLQNISSMDQNSLSIYPNFPDMNAPYTTHHWLDGAGTPLPEVTEDIDGNPRDPDYPDIGCCEYNSNQNSTTYAGSLSIGSSGDFGSFAEALDSLIWRGISGSVTINFLNGTYQERVLIRSIPGTSGQNSLVFQSQTGNADDVILTDSATTAEDDYLVKLYGSRHLTFRNMTFSATGPSYARSFHFYGHNPNINILNNIINGTSTGGRVIAGSARTDSVLIIGNVFNSGSGIELFGSDYYYRPTKTRIIGNVFNNVGVGIRLDAHHAPLIENNEIHETSITGDGILLGGCYGALKVLKNRIYFRSYSGITISGCESSASERGLIANNFVKNTGPSTSYLRGIQIQFSCSFQDIFYNTVIFEEVGSYGVFLASSAGYPASNMRVLNNNFICLDQVGAYSVTPSMISVSDYNNIYNASNALAAWGGVSCPNLDSLQRVSGQDLHSISVYPMFPDLNQPYTTHPWLDAAATPVPEVSDDIDGNPRDPNSPDIGCCEFNGNPSSILYTGTLTIGPGGNFGSFSEAYDSLGWRGVSGPVTVEALAGDYQEQLKIRSIPGTSWQDTVVFTLPQWQSGRCIPAPYHTPAGVDDNYTIWFCGADHLSFELLTLFSDTTGTLNYRVFDFYGETENIQIRQNRIYGPPYHTVSGSSGDYQLMRIGTLNYAQQRVITGNYFEGGGHNAITTSGDQSRLYITDNTFRLMRTAIFVSGNYAPVITGNVMDQIFLSNLYPYAVRLYQISGPFEIVKNKINASGRHALYIQACNCTAGEEGLIANNFIIAGGGTGNKYGLIIDNSSNLKIYSNNINIVGSSTLTNGRSMNITGACSGLQVINNILSNSCDGYTYYVGDPTDIVASDYNDIYTTGPNLAYWGGTTVPSLDSLRNLSGKDLYSISADPGYYEPASNLHVTNPVLDSTATLLPEIIDDIDGDLRDPNFPDIGADEFVPGNYPPFVVNPLSDVTYGEDSGMHLVCKDLNTIFSDPNPMDTLRFTFISANTQIHHHLISDSFFVSAESNFFGIGNMVVIAHDTPGLMVRDTFQVTITNLNDPPTIIGLPDTVTFEADTSATLDIWSYVEDPDIVDSLLQYLFEPTATALVALYDSTTGELSISSLANTNYSAPIYMTVTDDSGATAVDSILAIVIGVVGIEDNWQDQIPTEFVLMQNYPNPFNPVTNIRYGLPRLAHVRIEIFNILGQDVATLIDEQQPAGYHNVRLEANRLGSGVYFYRLTAGNYCQTRKLIVMK